MVSSRKMIPVCFMLFMLLFQSLNVAAQTWNEIFKQKKTQIKYLGQQIAALELYIGYARKGYEIVDGGITVVKDMTGGEFNLHRNFFASLAVVNPAVKNSSRVMEIASMQISIIGLLKHWTWQGLNTQEQLYLSLVKANLIAECMLDMDALLLVITSAKLEMKDDQRLERLEKICLSMQDKYQFTASFSNGIDRLIRQRRAEADNIDAIRKLYTLTP